MALKVIPDVGGIYLLIGQMIFNAIPGKFSVAWVRIEMLDDVSSCGMFYRKPDDRFQYLNVGLEEIESKFRELRNLFTIASCEAWTGATFIMSEDGDFSVDTTYDDILDFGQASERRKAWIKKYLGENPLIDWR